MADSMTRAKARTALASMLIMARSVDHLSVNSLCRSYNLPARQIEMMLAAERLRRAGA